MPPLVQSIPNRKRRHVDRISLHQKPKLAPGKRILPVREMKFALEKSHFAVQEIKIGIHGNVNSLQTRTLVIGQKNKFVIESIRIRFTTLVSNCNVIYRSRYTRIRLSVVHEYSV